MTHFAVYLLPRAITVKLIIHYHVSGDYGTFVELNIGCLGNAESFQAIGEIRCQ